MEEPWEENLKSGEPFAKPTIYRFGGLLRL